MTTLNEPGVDFHLKLNQQQFNIPSELLNRNWEKFNTLYDTYSTELHGQFNILSILLENSDNDQQSIEKLNDIINSVNVLQKRLSQLQDNELTILERIEKRVEYFRRFEKLRNDSNNDGLLKWYRSYTDLLIADYLVRHGSNSTDYKSSTITNSGIDFIKARGLEDLIDYDVLIEANKVSMELLENKNLGPLLEWIINNSSHLTEKGSHLQFQALLQEYIELVRCSDYKGAIGWFQTQLSKFMNVYPRELKLAAGILVFFKSCLNESRDNEQTNEQKLFQTYFRKQIYQKHPLSTLSSNNVVRNAELSRYGPLLDRDRWKNLNEMFLHEFYSLYKISYHDPLLIYISLGISSLKTKDCGHPISTQLVSHENEKVNDYIKSNFVSTDCPVCNPDILPLAENLPFAHHIQSSLFENPVMLPNGNIYDSEKLVSLSRRLNKMGYTELRENQVMDPIDKSIYATSDFVKMYPT
ncbi:unnamed protein product [Kluyveromyces dobzhanskii CBS 2104]|uniref:WGS project CCBQ000000000 data, contig 00017 n=1 Tax=Kluyveromyces dobzhanskii CBS 2104 TaxID=1427455 RepID=A0A0A8L8X9_9SACH|nr:unnamed protein product [Kluyveromyces dobzhanskii CBS 2104]